MSGQFGIAEVFEKAFAVGLMRLGIVVAPEPLRALDVGRLSALVSAAEDHDNTGILAEVYSVTWSKVYHKLVKSASDGATLAEIAGGYSHQSRSDDCLSTKILQTRYPTLERLVAPFRDVVDECLRIGVHTSVVSAALE